MGTLLPEAPVIVMPVAAKETPAMFSRALLPLSVIAAALPLE